MEKLTQQEKVRRQKMQDLIDMGIDPFGHAFTRDAKCGEITEKYDSMSKEELEEKEVHVTIAGRIMRKRRQGKAGFMNIQDVSGDIQIYCRKDVLGEEQYEIFKKNDIGDIVGAVEPTTGIEVWQPITKKIVKIKNNQKEIISYEVGTTGGK